MEEIKKGQKAEMIEDIALLIDVVFTFVAVFLGNIGMSYLSNVSFVISGFGLMVTPIQRRKKVL